MGKGRQREAAVCEPHPFGVIAQDLVSCLNDHAFVFGRGCSAHFLNAMLDYELMNLGHVTTLHCRGLALQPWSLRAQAIRSY